MSWLIWDVLKRHRSSSWMMPLIIYDHLRVHANLFHPHSCSERTTAIFPGTGIEGWARHGVPHKFQTEDPGN